MANKMLIDASHPEETRVVVLRGNRVEEFDFESASRKQLRGNIYLAKVTRVEPSLQAAFVDYGGNRHGFLAFSEIHPDYYQIPVADRQALLDEEARAHRDEEDEEDERRSRRRNRGANRRRNRDAVRSQAISSGASEDQATGETAEMPVDAVSDAPAIAASSEDDEHAHDDHELHDHESHDHDDSDHDEDDHNGHDRDQYRDGHDEDDEDDEEEDEDESESDDDDDEDEVADENGDDEDDDEDGDDDDDDEDDGDDDDDDDRRVIQTSGDQSERLAPQAASQHVAETPAVAPRAEEPRFFTVDEPYSFMPERVIAAEQEAFAAQQAAITAKSGDGSQHYRHDHDDNGHADDEGVEDVGGDSDALEEVPFRQPRHRRQYKIQEVIKRRQVLLVQVVKEERGTKGAALTTYLSLAGRYSVLMPNTARGGGISRKITSSEDRRRLKEIVEELQVPEGMGVILRTAGASRNNSEIQRDFEYLLRLWETVRDLTLKSTAPCLVYEEGSLVKRSIRDLYHKDIDDIIVEGDASYKEAKDFMRMLMPGNAGVVRSYSDMLPLFTRYGIDAQLDAMFSPTVQLKSGGYIVINQTEALVAIDVNSGRSTREHSIEETALKTNMEAAAEVARQLRLRDLAGLIVVDFIDMDEKRNNRVVERKLKEALKSDRARIQVGRISHFGLLEMSRQRIRTSVLESSTECCPTCGGTGHIRSVASVALQLLRSIDETLMKGATHNLIVRSRADVAIYVLNHKRAHLRRLEESFRVTITITADPTMTGQPAYAVDRGEQVMSLEQARALLNKFEPAKQPREEREPQESAFAGEDTDEESAGAEITARGEDGERETAENGEDGQRRGRRRRGRRGRGGRARNGEDHDTEHHAAAMNGAGAEAEASASEAHEQTAEAAAETDDEAPHDAAPAGADEAEGEPRRRRRGRRGGRRSRRHREGDEAHADQSLNGAGDGEESDDDQQHPDEGRDIGEERASGEEITAAPESKPAPESEPAVEAPQAPEPVTAQDAEAAAPTMAAEESAAKESSAPKRRSTIREKPPVFAGAVADTLATIPAPAPEASAPPPAVEPQSAVEEAAKPRRLGWWSRRS